MKKAIYLCLFFTFLACGLAEGQSKSKTSKRKKVARIQYGTASFYDNKFNGRKTANGDRFAQKELTAAHNNVPLGSWVRVTNLLNKKTVIVKITDRLHYKNRRLIDLSRAAATALGVNTKGLLRVKVENLGKKRPSFRKRLPYK